MLYHGDCLEIMPTLPEQSIDAIICDPPYGTTACKWDVIIPFDAMWKNIARVIKPNGAIVLFGSQPFTSALIMSNIKWFRYQWVWNKAIAGNPFTAKYQPLKIHEDVAVFSYDTHNYYPQMRQGKMRKKGGGYSKLFETTCTITKNDQYNPISILEYSNAIRGKHPTQKPVALMEYLIKTYTNEGDTVLDFTMGSGSTGVAAKNTNRKFIGIEKEEKYYTIAKERIGV